MQTPRVLPAAALVLCGGIALPAQQAGTSQPPSFRTGVEIVTIDVGVVDRQGQPLRGLDSADFVVSVAGQRRRVVSAEFVDVAAAQAKLTARPEVVPVSSNEGGGIGRQFVFVVDQSTLQAGNARYVAKAASRFFDRLTFADRSALMLMPLGPHVQFTWAHDRVRQGLQRVTGLSSPATTWEYGSLTEARDIANRNPMALRTVGERECRTSGIASGGGGFGPIGGSGPPVPSPTPPPPGGTPGGGEGGTPAPSPPAGGATPTTTPRNPGSGGGGFGADACMRDVQMQAESTWRGAQMTSLSSLTALRQLLASLTNVSGDKTLILISGGWPLDEREEMSLLQIIASEAAAARVTLFTLFVPPSTVSADRRSMSMTPARDAYLHSGPLETLAAMTGGGSYQAEVNAEAAFDRIGRELGGYYRISVEKDPNDQDSRNRRLKVQVSRGGVTVRARDIFDVRTYEDRDWAARLASALDSPVPATGLGLRVTSYLAADADARATLKLVIAGEATRLQPGQATFQLVVRDMEGKKVLAGEQPLGEARADAMPFSTHMSIAPGSYIVRAAVMDGTGRVGSVDHRVEVRAVPIGPLLAAGPVLIRVPSRPTAEARLALDTVNQDERLALEVGLEGDASQLASTDVVFEIAATAEGPALMETNAMLSRGPRDGSVVAQGMADIRVLPPGEYVARAKVKSSNQALGELRRAFAVVGAPRVPTVTAGGAPAAVAVGRVAPAALAVRASGTVPPFAVEQVLAPQVLGGFLDRVAARPDAVSPMIRELVDRARTEDLRQLVISDTLAAQQPVAAFLRGLALLAQKKLELASNAFRGAMRASSDFYPAMVYLGACYAAGGKDKEAAGAWRTALIKEGDAVALHVLLADAFLRQGTGDLALETVERARLRWPDDDGLKRRFVLAALLAGKFAEGLKAVDELVEKRVEDDSSLTLALLVLYEGFVNGQPIETVDQDRARMMRLADAYRARGGPSLALVETWVAAAGKKN